MRISDWSSDGCSSDLLRRSWLSREVALFGLYAPLAALAVLVPGAAPVAAAVGVVGVYASARLYIVPGRPSWDSPLTIASFAATGLAIGPVITDRKSTRLNSSH